MDPDTVVSTILETCSLGSLDTEPLEYTNDIEGGMKMETHPDIGIAEETIQPQLFFWLPHGPRNLEEQAKEISGRW